MSELVLVRHSETEWSASGHHTGVTDIPLTRAGELQVSQLRPLLDGRRLGLVLTSPNLRARRTAELLGWANHEVDPDLAEWDYGGYEGRTTAEISVELSRPWWIWTDPVPPGATPGETIDQIAQRADRGWLGLPPCCRRDRTWRSSDTGTIYGCWLPGGSGWIRKQERSWRSQRVRCRGWATSTTGR
jgi:broad specificity phosphatase PhoE